MLFCLFVSLIYITLPTRYTLMLVCVTTHPVLQHILCFHGVTPWDLECKCHITVSFDGAMSSKDAFLLFQSPNSPTVPQEKIHHITTMYPEDPRAPFYDPSGKPMLPLARLYLTRNAVIPKSCDEQSLDRILEEEVQVAENTEDTSRRELCQLTRRQLSIICFFSLGALGPSGPWPPHS